MTAGMAEALRDKLMEDEPETDRDISASDINRQSWERLTNLALHDIGS